MQDNAVGVEHEAGLAYQVHGSEMQIVKIELAPDQTIIA